VASHEGFTFYCIILLVQRDKHAPRQHGLWIFVDLVNIQSHKEGEMLSSCQIVCFVCNKKLFKFYNANTMGCLNP
jgi:hypothetical protein